MRALSVVVAVAALQSTNAFQATGAITKQKICSATELYGYIPDGFTAESYKKFKQQEREKEVKQKNLGGLGPRGFKSRSMQSFQEALEKGEANHLMPMFNSKEKLKSGKIKMEDIPYMQRGGSWDNSDVKGAKKKRWLDSDKKYSKGGFRKEQSVSILGVGEGLDWTGKKAKGGPESVSRAAPKFQKNYKAPNVNDFGKKGGEKKKGLFGMF